jgi:hypothetical protein
MVFRLHIGPFNLEEDGSVSSEAIACHALGGISTALPAPALSTDHLVTAPELSKGGIRRSRKSKDLECVWKSVPVRPDIGSRFNSHAQALDGIGEFRMEVIMCPLPRRFLRLLGERIK